MSARRLLSPWAVGLVGMATLASAQEKTPPLAAPDRAFAIAGSPDSTSTGRQSSGSETNAKAKKGSAQGKATRSHADASVATFPGFRLLSDGRSRIYVELTRPVTVDERRGEGTLVYTLHGARVLVRNNKNALITTHFATAVARARLLSAGANLELVIDLRKAVSATQKIVPGDNGSARLEIDFPAGDYPLAPGLFGPLRAAERPEAEPSATESAGDGTAPAPPATVPVAPAPPAIAPVAPAPAPREKSTAGPPSP